MTKTFRFLRFFKKPAKTTSTISINRGLEKMQPSPIIIKPSLTNGWDKPEYLSTPRKKNNPFLL